MSTVTFPDFVGCDTGGAGGGTTDDDLRKIYGLQNLFDAARLTSYGVPGFDGDGDLITLTVWDTNGGTKLFTRTLGYSAPPKNLLTITTVDEVAVCTLTTTLTYSGLDIATITKAIT